MSSFSRPKTMEDNKEMENLNQYQPHPVERLKELANDVRTNLEGMSELDIATELDAIAFSFDTILMRVHHEDKRPAPQAHYRVKVDGLKRVPDATFTLEGDDRDIDVEDFWRRRDEFQREVDRRYPLEQQPHMVELPPVA